MDPLFPRLHINDAEKRGPRAPPRNKMALYEQLSIPSQRFNSESAASMLPLLPTNSGSLVPSTSSTHGGSHNRSLYSAFCNSPASSLLAERLRPYSSGAMNLNTSTMNLEWPPLKPTEYHTSNAPDHLSMAANCRSFQPHSISNSKNSSVKKLADEDDVRVPTFVPNGQQILNEGKLTNSSPNNQLQTVCINQAKQTSTADLESRQHNKRIESEVNSKLSLKCEDHARKPILNLTNGDKTSVSLNEEKRSTLVDDSSRLRDSYAQLHHQYRASQEKQALRDGVSAAVKTSLGKRNAYALEGVSCSTPSNADNHRSRAGYENVTGCRDDQCGSEQVGEVNRNADDSDASIVDSISGVDISPDDVVGVIGQKQFWKARRVIVHQQRVLAVQVFELHRLMKVQRLFAASPDLLLENKLYLKKPLINAPPSIAKPKDGPQKPNPNTESSAENILRKLPLPSRNSGTDKQLNTPQPLNYKPYSANAPLKSVATDAKPPPWCFPPPPGNQWLVPIMSPSEGLIYKPYTGPCPPTSGFMAPVYGGCGHMNLSPLGGDFSNAAFGIPPLGQPYYSPYGMPLMNPSVSSSAVDQQVSKESAVPAITATSPHERVVKGGDALPLFPTAPTLQFSDQPAQSQSTEQQTSAIKVVPYNPSSASESAARIFRSIQEERRQSD